MSTICVPFYQCYFFFRGLTTLVGLGLLCESDRPDAETSSRQHATTTTDRHPYRRRDSNPQSQQASDRRPTPWTARSLGPALTNAIRLRNFVTP